MDNQPKSEMERGGAATRSNTEQGRTNQTGSNGWSSSNVSEQAASMARNLGEQARSAVSSASENAGELARRAREQASAASETLYQQGAKAGEYLSRNVNEYPLASLLIAGAIGYGIAYLIHNRS